MGDTICQHNLQSDKLASFKRNESTVKPRLTATSVIRSPRYFGHFILAARQNGHTFSCKNTLVKWSPVNMAKLFFGSIGDRINGVPLYTLTFSILNSRAWQVSSLNNVHYAT